MTEQTGTVRPYASANRLAVAAAVLLAIFAFVSLPLVGVSLSNIRIFGVLQSISPTVEATEAGEPGRESAWVMSKGMQAVASLGKLLLRPVMLVGVVAAVVCLIWLYRVHENLPALGARNLKFTPLWAVGFWFIPFAHFVRPYQVVREVWDASDPRSGGDAIPGIGSPTALLGWWWALMVSALVLRFYYPLWAGAEFTRGGMFGVSTYLDREFYYVEATSAAVNMAAAILGIFVVLSIDRMQTEKHRLVAADRLMAAREEALPQEPAEPPVVGTD